mgnify:FL=1
MIELNPPIIQVLQDINFMERYENLSKSFNDKRTPLQDRLRYIDGEIIIDSLMELGYEVDFDSKEKFFKIKERQIKNYIFAANIILENGMVDLVWIVRENGNLILGLPLGEYSRLMINPDYRIKKPIFATYEDLDEIFQIAFQLFEDFKKTIIALE